MANGQQHSRMVAKTILGELTTGQKFLFVQVEIDRVAAAFPAVHPGPPAAPPCTSHDHAGLATSLHSR